MNMLEAEPWRSDLWFCYCQRARRSFVVTRGEGCAIALGDPCLAGAEADHGEHTFWSARTYDAWAERGIVIEDPALWGLPWIMLAAEHAGLVALTGRHATHQLDPPDRNAGRRVLDFFEILAEGRDRLTRAGMQRSV